MILTAIYALQATRINTYIPRGSVAYIEIALIEFYFPADITDYYGDILIEKFN